MSSTTTSTRILSIYKSRTTILELLERLTYNGLLIQRQIKRYMLSIIFQQNKLSNKFGLRI